MISDSEIKITGMQSLIHALGEVQAERFITLIRRDDFDYTKWQQTLFNELSVSELSQEAQNYVNRTYIKQDNL